MTTRRRRDVGHFALGNAVFARIMGMKKMMDRFFYILGGFSFLVSLTGHLYARIRLRPGPNSDLDDYYYEFEDQHPGYARYTRWLQLTTAGGALGVLLLFLGTVL